MIPHLHKYKIECENTNNHKHKLIGYTDYMLGIDIFHFHQFWGISSYENHTHYFSGITGLPIRTSFGHVHKIEGILELNNLHVHKFNSFTLENISYNSKRITIKVAYL